MENNALKELISMSKYAGERFDLVQAGGGNTSVKFGESSMYIKASGYLLSELSKETGFATVDVLKVLAILDDDEILNEKDKRQKDKKASEKLGSAILAGTDRPSIETYLHALLYTYTFHVHAIAVNTLTSHKNWLELLRELDSEALCIPYETPGIELAILLKQQLESYAEVHDKLPKVVFLQSHGLIVSSDELEEISRITEQIVIRAEERSGLDLSRYRNTTRLSKLFNRTFDTDNIAYLSEDKMIYDLLESTDDSVLSKPFSPDGYVFCGNALLRLDRLDSSALKSYFEKHHEPPKLVRYKSWLYILAQDLKKAKMIEDVFKNNVLVANTLNRDLTFLKDEEVKYLGNWEAEKYRQKLS